MDWNHPTPEKLWWGAGGGGGWHVWPEILQASFTLKDFLTLGGPKRSEREHLVLSAPPPSFPLHWSPTSGLSPLLFPPFLHFFPSLTLLLLHPPLHTFLVTPSSPLPAALLWAWVNRRNEGDRYTDGKEEKSEKKEAKRAQGRKWRWRAMRLLDTIL